MERRPTRATKARAGKKVHLDVMAKFTFVEASQQGAFDRLPRRRRSAF